MSDWRSEFEVLIAALFDGNASDQDTQRQDTQRLEQLLANCPEALARYLELMSVHAMLRWRCGAAPAVSSPSPLMGEGRQAVSLSNGSEDSALSPSPLMGEGRGEGSSATPAKPAKSPVLGFLGGVVDYVSHSHTLMFALIGGSLGLYFAVQLGSVLVSRLWEQNAAHVAVDRGAGTEKHGQLVDQPGGTANGAKIVARLTNAVDCQWKVADSSQIQQPDLQPLDIGSEFHAGQKLNLAAGLAELTFDSGAKVILTAPARFDVTDAVSVDLQRGKLTAKVPHKAAGFTIATPGGKVVDLGTEFGVKVNDDGAMNVIVYVGDVQVESGSGGSGSGGSDQPRVVHVHAGQAVAVGPDHIAKPIPPENEHFVRELAPLGNAHAAEAAYVEFVKKLKPVVWFRMEGKDTDRVLHDEMGGPDAKLFWDGPGNPFVSGPIGKGLWLRGLPLKDGAVVPHYPQADHGKLSVVAWAYANSRPGWATIAANWGSAAGQFHFGLHPNANGEGVDLHVILPDGNARWTPFGEGETHPFPLHEWQHVAFVVDGPEARLYRQGREVASMKYGGLPYPPRGKSLGIGMESCDAGDPTKIGEYMWWDGKLDEVAVFNSALTAEEIKKLAGSAPR